MPQKLGSTARVPACFSSEEVTTTRVRKIGGGGGGGGGGGEEVGRSAGACFNRVSFGVKSNDAAMNMDICYC